MLRAGIRRIGNYSSSLRNFKTMASRKDVAVLFDVDGTLTKAMQIITEGFDSFLQQKIKPLATMCIVGGSDFSKICKQMGGDDCVKKFDFVFSENGLVFYKDGILKGKQSIVEFIGEETLQKFINYCLKYMSGITLPCKRGNFVEYRTGMLNISPIGRSCSQKERDEFVLYDQQHGIRKSFVEALKKEFPDSGLQFAIGGQISIDVFPIGWDKTYCLQHLMKDNNFKEIHFFGDKTLPGGNDYEVFEDNRTIGHTVTSPDDTKRQLMELFNIKE